MEWEKPNLVAQTCRDAHQYMSGQKGLPYSSLRTVFAERDISAFIFIGEIIMDDKQMAFPCAGNPHEDQMIFGMELRDWFAGMALTGAIGHAGWSYEEVAERAYGIADAMIKARGAK